LGRVDVPFALESAHRTTIAFGDIRFVRQGQPTLACQ